MISLNLLPDLKREYLKTQRYKRLFVVGSLLIMAGFAAIAILLGIFVFGVQRLQLAQTQSNIDDALTQLEAIEDLDKIVTIQKQLDALPGLHENRPAADKLFGYLGDLVPNDISLSKVEILFASDSVQASELTGTAPNPKAVNVLVDTLKNAEFTYEGAEAPIKPFVSVILDKTSVDDNGVSYTLLIKFDPLLFDNTLTGAKLTVPKITTSASITERPSLFNAEEDEEE